MTLKKECGVVQYSSEGLCWSQERKKKQTCDFLLLKAGTAFCTVRHVEDRYLPMASVDKNGKGLAKQRPLLTLESAVGKGWKTMAVCEGSESTSVHRVRWHRVLTPSNRGTSQ